MTNAVLEQVLQGEVTWLNSFTTNHNILLEPKDLSVKFITVLLMSLCSYT